MTKKREIGKLPKFCGNCNRTVTNDGWSGHLKTKIHLENVEKNVKYATPRIELGLSKLQVWRFPTKL